MRVEEGFKITPFTEGNPYTTDPVLPSLIKRLLPGDARKEVDEDLERFGEVVLTSLKQASARAEEPKVVQYNQWGQRVDDLQTSEGWRALKSIMQEEGAVAIPFERKYGELSRVYGFMKELLSVGDSQVVFCPLSMTDGCARVLELIGTPALKRDIIPRLISRDPSVAFTAGQWMTERPGGSDVSQTETVATPIPGATSPYGPVYSINGFKWFSSATDSDVSVALARTGDPSLGSRSLSLFLIPLRRPLLRSPGHPVPSPLTNNIRIHRLKNKVGTKIVPTAELSLDGAEAYLLGPLNQGVKLITPVLNITRVHSAVASVGSIRRCLAIASSYSKVRAIAGGKQLLQDNALHMAVLAKVSLLYRALAHMVFGAVLLLGKVECGVASEEEELRLRFLTPAVKAFGAQNASVALEECMASLGGQGYMEENGFGTIIKDALVEKIWEGTVNVLSMDTVRATAKPGVVQAFVNWTNFILNSVSDTLLSQVSQQLSAIRSALPDLVQAYTAPVHPLSPRAALNLLSHIASSVYLLEHAVWAVETSEPNREIDIEVFKRWVEEGGLKEAVADLKQARAGDKSRIETDRKLVFGLGTTKDRETSRQQAHL
ncbi:acyl-CoA dehydrogenase family protein [Abortiporus biennis]